MLLPGRSLSSHPVSSSHMFMIQHPTIYEVTNDGRGGETFTRARNLETSPYYRWDNRVKPRTEAFPPGFRMIAASNDPGANQDGESGENMLTECCDLDGEEEDCQSWGRLEFPRRNCDFLGIAFGELSLRLETSYYNYLQR